MIGWLGGNSRGNLTFGVAQRIPSGCVGCLGWIAGLLLLFVAVMVLVG